LNESYDDCLFVGNLHSSHWLSKSSSFGASGSVDVTGLEHVNVVWRENESWGVKVVNTVSKFGYTLYGLRC